MSAKHLTIDEKVDKSLSKIPQKVRDRLIARLALIQQNPLIGVKLGGELKGYSKYRVGDYRIIYSFDSRKSLIFVAKIEHRQGAYK